MLAPPERVFEALTDPEALVAWLPPAGMRGRFEHADLRPGGSYRLVLTYDDPDDASAAKAPDGTDVVEARILEVDPGRRIVQAIDFESDDPAFAGTMTMTWSVAPAAGGTRVAILADDVPVGISAEDHAVGIHSSLVNLATHLE